MKEVEANLDHRRGGDGSNYVGDVSSTGREGRQNNRLLSYNCYQIVEAALLSSISVPQTDEPAHTAIVAYVC